MLDPASERLQDAVRLHELGLDIQRENIRRRSPEATEAELDGLLETWIAGRPMDHSAV